MNCVLGRTGGRSTCKGPTGLVPPSCHFYRRTTQPPLVLILYARVSIEMQDSQLDYWAREGGSPRSSEWRWTYFYDELVITRMTCAVVSFQLYSSIPLRRRLTFVGFNLLLWSIASTPNFSIKNFDYLLYFVIFHVFSEFVYFRRCICCIINSFEFAL